jgi:outer membrane protein OmpA-like peptidoglycan-associated protein
MCLASVAQAQDDSELSGSGGISAGADTDSGTSVEIGGALEGEQPAAEDEEYQKRDMWFLGAYWRHLWVPRLMEELWFDLAPPVSTGIFGPDPNIGLVATFRNDSGFSIVFGLGYSSFEFDGAFRTKGDEERNTEAVESDLGFWYGTASFLWSTEFHPMFAIEYGFGFDLGIVTGDINRSEAYYDYEDGEWKRCERAGVPDPYYCEDPLTEGADTDPPNELGAHYDVNVGKLTEEGGSIPNVFLFPALPHLALRFTPIPELAIKFEAGYAIADIWIQFSVHGSIWQEKKRKLPPELRVVDRPTAPVAAPPPPAKGKIRGVVVEEGVETAVAAATVTFVDREVSPVQTLEDGTFISFEFDPGEVLMEIEHDEYEDATCTAVIPEEGGDVEQTCVMVPKPRTGAIEGKVLGPSGPVAGAKVKLLGPESRDLVTDEWGFFKVADAAPGTYTANVDAEAFMFKTEQFEVVVRETSTPEITLTEKPKKTLVKVTKREIKIDEQIHFATGSAVIKPESTPLMTEIADVLMRHTDILKVEIQGHTDSRGSNRYNQRLSQQRADSVRSWLIQAGIASDRLTAVGYGESLPIDSNRTKSGRAANRRVQFIIKERAEEAR